MERLLVEDLCGNPHWLSLNGKIISFNCKRAPATHDGDTTELIFRSLSFGGEGNTFLEAASGEVVISRKRSTRVDVVKCKCAFNVRTKVTEPCVLVAKKSGKGENFQYSLLTLSTDRLQTCFEFKLPYQMRESVSILHGPTVLWSHAAHVFYTSHTGEVRQIPLQLSHVVIGELPIYKEHIFVLGLQTRCSNTQSTSQAQGCFVESGHVFEGTMILPHPYICITRCILVLSAEKVDGVLKSSVVVATSNRQLVYFESGIVRDVCQLPFEQPENILVVNTGRTGSLFVISFQQGHVCALWKETFKIASQWSRVSSVHVDDFLGCGADQMLLVFKDQGVTGQPLEEFLLTDLCGISYSRGLDSGVPKAPPPPPENELLTLRALESRLQSGLTVLQELQSDVRVKDRVLQQSVRALTDVVSERETVLTQHEQEGLVALWDCDDDDENESKDEEMQDTPAVSSKPQVDKLWHRIIEERMVVGVILTTDSSVPVAGVSLSILTETGQSSTPAVIQTQSQVFWLPTPCSSSSSSSSSLSSACVFSEPAAKRSKQHNIGRPNDLNTCRLAVTAVTRLTPLLNSGCVKCHVMVHYVQRRDAFALVSKPTPVVLHCGQVVLDVQSHFQTRLLKSPELKTDEIKEDLLSLMTVLDRWVFHIDSPDHSLEDIDGWIEKREDCKRIEVSPQYLLLNSSGPSAVMLLRWHQITPFQGELSVHSSQLQTLQFLDSLLAYLPASCSIQSVKRTRGQGEAQILSLALEKEVVSLRECVSSVFCEEEEGRRKSLGLEETTEPVSAKGLEWCRDFFQQEVERSRTRLSPLVDVGRYRQLTHNMYRVQLDGDLAALLDTQRTLHS